MTNAERNARWKARRKAGLVHIDTFVPESAAPAIWQAIDDIVGRLAREAEERERIAALSDRDRQSAAAKGWNDLVWSAGNRAIERVR